MSWSWIATAGVAATLLGATAPDTANPSTPLAVGVETCALGREILSGLPETGTPRTDVSIYDDRGDHSAPTFRVPPLLSDAHQKAWEAARPSNLFKACPGLRGELPRDARLATDQDLARARAFPAKDPLTVFWIGAPVFDPAMSVAVVATGYTCPGLCAGVYRTVYVRDRGRWVRLAPPRAVAFS